MSFEAAKMYVHSVVIYYSHDLLFNDLLSDEFNDSKTISPYINVHVKFFTRNQYLFIIVQYLKNV